MKKVLRVIYFLLFLKPFGILKIIFEAKISGGGFHQIGVGKESWTNTRNFPPIEGGINGKVVRMIKNNKCKIAITQYSTRAVV